jgi:HAD superfamily hydrolase (TIGR01484 family)
MNDLSSAPHATFASVHFVLTDMDETLTHKGRLPARTYEALERLLRAGLTVIPVTAAPAGWCDQMARMWPVDGVIAENGGVFIARSGEGRVERTFWHSENDRAVASLRLAAMERAVKLRVPSAILADDQPFRLTSIAFARPLQALDVEALLAALAKSGAKSTCNNLWVLGWIGDYDKLSMSCRVLWDVYGLDPEAARTQVAYYGDSENDSVMFGHFTHTIGMNTVRDAPLTALPKWITAGPGGEGFVEAADAILRDHGRG